MVQPLPDAPARPDVRVADIRGVAHLEHADALLRTIWGTRPTDDPPIPLDVLCALSYTGGYVGGAYQGDRLVGVAAGFPAAGSSLHSHVAGVAAEARGRGVGYALKLHQRDWARAHGLGTVSWTYDPLVRRNAYFNLYRLGAQVEAYLPNFYGPMRDGINDGEVSDRLFVTWPVGSGQPAPAHTAQRLDAIVQTAVPILDEDGSTHGPAGAAHVRCATPPDIETLRREQPDQAHRWRIAVRAALAGALDDGYRVIGFSRSGWYLLERNA